MHKRRNAITAVFLAVHELLPSRREGSGGPVGRSYELFPRLDPSAHISHVIRTREKRRNEKKRGKKRKETSCGRLWEEVHTDLTAANTWGSGYRGTIVSRPPSTCLSAGFGHHVCCRPFVSTRVSTVDCRRCSLNSVSRFFAPNISAREASRIGNFRRIGVTKSVHHSGQIGETLRFSFPTPRSPQQSYGSFLGPRHRPRFAGTRPAATLAADSRRAEPWAVIRESPK